MRVHAKVSSYLAANGLEPAAVARKANIPVAAFTALLDGKQKMYAEELIAICRALNVRPETFIEPKSYDA